MLFSFSLTQKVLFLFLHYIPPLPGNIFSSVWQVCPNSASANSRLRKHFDEFALTWSKLGRCEYKNILTELSTLKKLKCLSLNWREFNNCKCDKTLRNLSPVAQFKVKVNESDNRRENCTYMSIMISLRKTPSAKSVMDSMSALPLKVLLAYNNDTNY